MPNPAMIQENQEGKHTIMNDAIKMVSESHNTSLPVKGAPQSLGNLDGLEVTSSDFA